MVVWYDVVVMGSSSTVERRPLKADVESSNLSSPVFIVKGIVAEQADATDLENLSIIIGI